MASTNINIKGKSTNQLPVPQVKLIPKATKIDYDNSSSIYTLLKSPIVVALDLTEEQIEKGVYVEMAHYRRGKSASNDGKNESGYVVPSPQIAGVNPLGNKWTRGGSHIGTADRPNHYKVTSQNEEIPVYEYLKNRHVERIVQYIDTNGNSQFINVITPNQGIKSSYYSCGRAFMYSSQYRPYYFMFRYVMWDEESNNWVSGGWSRVIKLSNEKHPFNVDARASAVIGRQVGGINSLFNKDIMKCWFETRLP